LREIPGSGDDCLTIGVLSPRLAATYFGPVVAGIAQAAAMEGVTVVGIQTFDPVDADINRDSSRFRRRVGWDSFSGVISLVNAVDSNYLFKLKSAGIPIVLVSNDVEGLNCPVVSSDNRSGITSVVDHLVAHGHRRIAFVGSLKQTDIRERYDAYREALACHGIGPDARLLFEARDNIERGGAEAGEALLAAGLPSTAVVCATDYNAVGLIGVLKAAGLVLPRDQAIVGFDDTETAALITPAVSSVRQDLAGIGEKAAKLVIALARHENVPADRYSVPTRLIVRSSCGCARDAQVQTGTKPVALTEPTGAGLDLHQMLLDMLTEQGASEGVAEEAAFSAAETITRVLQAPGDKLSEELTSRLSQAAEELCSVNGRFGVVIAAVECARNFGLHALQHGAGCGESLDARIREISLALSQAYARERESELRRFCSSLAAEDNVGLDLLRNPQNAQGGLPFLNETRVRAAYLGLWRQGPWEPGANSSESDILELAGSFVSDASATLPLGNRVRVEAFPPASLVSFARPDEAEITILVPVRTATKDWGLLALVGPIEVTVATERDFYFQCAGLLSVALEQESMVRLLRSSEERYALAALAANDGLWDWDLQTDTVLFSERWKAVVGCTPEQIGTSPDEWLQRVHPEDRSALDAALVECKTGRCATLESEHRLRSDNGSYRWVRCRALAIPGAPTPATRLVGSITDVTERRDLEEQLRHQALHDSLTGLPNRALVLDRAERMLSRAARSHGSVSVLFIDLDNFKEVNDGFGHAAGDKLLCSVAARLRRVTRDCDTVGRLGGDEFVVLADHGNSSDASELIAERIHDVLHPPFQLAGREYLVSASIGIATASDGTAESLLQEADVAMYQAKTGGKNRYVSFRPRMRHAAHNRLALEMDLASAISGGQLCLHYQPIFNLECNRICAMEALVRWQHPERGLLPPAEFIPLAEETGRLIIDLGRYVLSEACRAAAVWQRLGADLDVAVNLSARQLESEGIVADVSAALTESGLPPGRLVLEVTETAMIHDPDAVVDRMTRLKALGARISVDDFGTGYSSLASLRRFPVDVLKIDRSFIKSISRSPEDASVVQALVSLGRTLSLEVVAEGVEMDSQLDAVREAGCSSAQGFLLARPLNEEQLEALLPTLVPVAAQPSPA
jgi:diguanylate cyclase (GGDEF)-like protein/PAS domain S-box-containing protein